VKRWLIRLIIAFALADVGAGAYAVGQQIPRRAPDAPATATPTPGGTGQLVGVGSPEPAPTTRPTTRRPAARPASARPSSRRPSSSPAPTSPATPEPSQSSSAPTDVVSVGASCGSAGAPAITVGGLLAFCTTTGTDSDLRWRAAQS
jgi:hypothetical protein